MRHRGTRSDPGSTERGVPDFDAFFRNEYERLARALLILTGSKAQAEDLAQDAFLRVFERWDRVGTMDSPVGYLYRTALNLNRKRLRRSALLARRSSEPQPASDPLGQSDTKLDMLRALQMLPRPLREAVVLVKWYGMTSEQAAAVLGVQAVSVRGRVHRAMTMLHERFGEDA
jgi:RNA polymerase sigma-70 factor (ECF subfamily)